LKRIILTYALLAGLPLALLAQVDSMRTDSLVINYIKTPLDSAVVTDLQADTDREEDQEKPLVKIKPWRFHAPQGSQVVATDSTLRWQIWPSWADKLNRDPGIISYRLGTNLRSNAVQRFAHEPRYQQLYWDIIPLNDPVSGMVNWTLIPKRKVRRMYGRDLGTQYRNTFYLHQYYLTEPLSKFSYQESKFNHRTLRFEVGHNLTRRINLELSYWDRRGGGEYSNSEVDGRQIFTKLSYHMNDRNYFKVNYVNNKLDAGQPFGYTTGDLRLFSFDHYRASAKRSSANTVSINNMLSLNYYRRNADSTQSTDNLHASLYERSTKRNLYSTPDTTGYNIRTIGLAARKWWELGMLEAEANLNYEYFIVGNTDSPVLNTDNWGLFKAGAGASFEPVPYLTLKGDANVQNRSDGQSGHHFNVGAKFEAFGILVEPGLSTGSIMPTPQQLYWQSNDYSGDTELQNEQIQETHLKLSYDLFPGLTLGGHLQQKKITNPIMVQDSSFSNIEDYTSQAASAFVEWESPHIELRGSANIQQYFNNSALGLLPEDPRIWFKGGAYIKGYLFDRATYVKAGLSGMISPSPYKAAHYNPELDFWQPLSEDSLLPTFHHLDVDLSARVRSIIFILRFQNVLDDVTQRGYFETAGYPMSQRRFMFGVRALFRN